MDDVNKNDDDFEIKNFKKSIWVQDDSSKCRDTFKVIHISNNVKTQRKVMGKPTPGYSGSGFRVSAPYLSP